MRGLTPAVRRSGVRDFGGSSRSKTTQRREDFGEAIGNALGPDPSSSISEVRGTGPGTWSKAGRRFGSPGVDK